MASTPEAGTLPRVQPDELEAYRRELTGYCYRMLGSGFEAEDAVQDTMLRAWRSADRFEGRASVRSWLYRIATNVCMDMLRGRKRRARPMELGPPSPPDEGHLGGMLPEHLWVSPIPDSRVLPEDGDPAEIAVARDTVRMAFVTALQRARATLAALPSTDRPRKVAADQAALLARYVNAFERYDMASLVTLLHEDAVQSMPPFAMWIEGAQNITAWMVRPGPSECRGSRLVPVMANGCPGYGQYRRDPAGGHKPWALQVLEISGDRIAGMHFFLDAESLFPVFGLPAHLPA